MEKRTHYGAVSKQPLALPKGWPLMGMALLSWGVVILVAAAIWGAIHGFN